MAEPELNVPVTLTPNWKILILAHYIPLISIVALKLHTLLFFFIGLIRVGNDITYIQLPAQCPLEQKCYGGMNHAFLSLCSISTTEKNA